MRELNKSFWDFTTIIGTTTLSVPLMLVSESIQARYLGPSNYGKVTLVLSAISLLYLFGLSWLRTSFMRFGKEEFVNTGRLRKTTANFLVNNVYSFIIISIVFYVFRDSIFDFLEIQHSFAYWIILLGCLIVFFKNFVFELLKVIRLIKLQAFLHRLATKMFILFGMLLFVFHILEINVNYVIAIYLLSDIIIIIIGFYFIKPKYLFPLVFDKGMIKTIYFYSFPLIFSSWSAYVIDWIDTYVIKFFMNLEDVGIYQASYKIFKTLKSFWSVGIVTVTQPIIMVFRTNNQINKIKNFYIKRLIPQVSFLGMILISLIILFTDFGLNLLYGSEFSQSILPFKILIASQNFTIISSMLTAILLSFDMTKFLSIL